VKFLPEICNFYLCSSIFALTLKIKLNKFFQIVKELKNFIFVHVMKFEVIDKIWPEFFGQHREEIIGLGE
jgi:hypothetical protein